MAARGLHRTDPWKDTGTRGALLSNPFVWLKFYTNLFVWLAFNASGIKTSAISRPAFSGSCSLFHQSNHLTIKWNQNVFFNFFMHGRSHGRQGTTREILNFKILTKIWSFGNFFQLASQPCSNMPGTCSRFSIFPAAWSPSGNIFSIANGSGWGEQGRPRGHSAVNKLYELFFFFLQSA